MTATRALLACALLALAGCAAPAADAPAPTGTERAATPGTESPETTTTPPESVVVNGSLDAPVQPTYDRVQRLLGAEYDGTRVVVRDLTQYKTADYDTVPFFRLLGVDDPELDASEPTGLTTLDGTVYVSPAAAGPERVEQVLAHEFVHVGQLREQMVPWFGGLSLERVSLDRRLARRALVEGGAVYATDAYTRAHLPSVSPQSERVAAAYANGSSGDRVVWAQYHFGYRYVNATIDGPADLAVVYEDAPETTENILHPGERDRPAPLNVSVQSEEYARVASPTASAGELPTRIALRDAVGRAAAVNASAGWGNDRVLAFATDGGRSLAWVTRWDSPGDADEFEHAARGLGDEADAEAFRVQRAGDETVVAFAGSRSFVDTATATASAANVTVAA